MKKLLAAALMVSFNYCFAQDDENCKDHKMFNRRHF